MHESIEFQGRLLIDSKEFSLEQLPRVRVYRTTAGRFVVYRTWPIFFQLAPSYSIYSDLEGVEADPRALDTIWITEHDRRGEHTDLSSDIVRALRKAAGRRAVISIDQVDIRSAPGESVRLERDSESIRRRLQEHGQSDEDALVLGMYFLRATPDAPRHLSEIETAFAQIKPVSRFGNTAETLKDLQAGMRGYLNNDKRRRGSTHQLFVNPKRGFWGLSRLGDIRGVDVAHQLGVVRD